MSRTKYKSMSSVFVNSSKVGGPVTGLVGLLSDMFSIFAPFALIIFCASLVSLISIYIIKIRPALKTMAPEDVFNERYSHIASFSLVSTLVMAFFMVVTSINADEGGALAANFEGVRNFQQEILGSLDEISEKQDLLILKQEEVSEEVSEMRDDVTYRVDAIDKKLEFGFNSLAESIRNLIEPSDFINLDEQSKVRIQSVQDSKEYLKLTDLFERTFVPKFSNENKKLMTRIQNIVPKSDIGYFAKGYIDKLAGNDVSAVSNLDTALAINPSFAWAYILRGLSKSFATNLRGIAADIGQYKSIRNDFDVGIKLLPDESEFYLNSAKRRDRSEGLSGRIPDLSKAIALNPNNSEARIHRAYYYSRLALRTGDPKYKELESKDILEYYTLIKHQPDLEVQTFEVQPGVLRSPDYFVEYFPYDLLNLINSPTLEEHLWNLEDNNKPDPKRYTFRLVLKKLDRSSFQGECVKKYAIGSKHYNEENYYFIPCVNISEDGGSIEVTVLFDKKQFKDKRAVLRSINNTPVTLNAETIFIPAEFSKKNCYSSNDELYLLANNISLGW